MRLVNSGVLTNSKARDFLRDGKFSCLCLCGFGYELLNLVPNFVSHVSEDSYSLLGQSTGAIWVDDIPVSNMEREGEYRTPFLGGITDGNHVAEAFFYRLRDALGFLT